MNSVSGLMSHFSFQEKLQSWRLQGATLPPFRGILIPIFLSLFVLFFGQPMFNKVVHEDPDTARVEAFILENNPDIDRKELKHLATVIVREAAALQIPPQMRIDNKKMDPVMFLTALIQVESSFQREAVSRTNARGYMQLMPETVIWMDHKYGTQTQVGQLFTTSVNINRGVTYLNYLFTEFNTPRQICLAYNAGPGSFRRGFYIERYWLKILRSYRSISNEPTLTASL